MEDFTFDARSYLQRVRLSDKISPDLGGLTALQRAQLFTIPFENLDVQLGRVVDLDPAHIFEKLVRRPRGGYCFELNGLFLMALHAFGFEARPLLARVHVTGTPSGRGHQITLVELDGQNWVADVGFGKDTPLGPLQLKLDVVQEHGGQSFRLIDGGKFGTMYQKLEKGAWLNLYSFDMEYVCKADISYGNHYTSTNPHSFFTFSRIAVQHHPDGLSILYNYKCKSTRSEHVERMELPDEPEYLDVLKTHFGIELDAPYNALKPVAQE